MKHLCCGGAQLVRVSSATPIEHAVQGAKTHMGGFGDRMAAFVSRSQMGQVHRC